MGVGVEEEKEGAEKGCFFGIVVGNPSDGEFQR